MKNIINPLRSVLYLPGLNTRAIEKSLTSINADAFIYDLEDSVSPDNKSFARENLLSLFKFNKRNEVNSKKILRINSTQSPFFKEDIKFIEEIKKFKENSLDGVLIAKVEESKEIDEILTVCKEIDIWCMIETPKGILNSNSILSNNNISTAVLGLEDLRKDMGLGYLSERLEIMFPIQQVLLSAKVNNKTILDGVYIDVKNSEGFKKECEQALNLGFDGKTLIHPNTVEITNKTFTPSMNEIKQAQTLVSVFEKAILEGKSITVYEDKLVEELHVLRAKKLLEKASLLKLI